MHLEPGRMIGEHLRLLRLIGRGAMGSVWVAEHLGLRSQVAVKFMAQAMLDDPVSLQRFQQEATAAAEIRSPHVVRVFDHGHASDGVPYIVMELLDGESLEQRIKREGPLPMADVAAIVQQTCKALIKAHERGIVHRDIKPGNVFLSGDDDIFVKVLDFGVAKFSGQEAVEMTAQGNMVGTPVYMSPEQLFHGKSIDHRADLWSLAVVAYLALTGERPFSGTTLGELCVAIKNGDFVPPSRLKVGLPAELDVWFARAFDRAIERRFGSARELAFSFSSAIGLGSGPSSTPSFGSGASTLTGSSSGAAVPAPGPTPRWGRLGGLSFVAGALVLAALLFAASWGAKRSDVRDGESATRPSAEVSPLASATASTSSQPDGSRPAPVSTAPSAAASSTGAAPTASGAPAAPPRAPAVDVRSQRAAEQLGL